jgi:hypothetical protein
VIEEAEMHEWSVMLTQPNGAPPNEWRTTAVVVCALDALDAARRAQRVLPGWTAVLMERTT